MARVFNQHFTNIKCEASIFDEDCTDYIKMSFLDFKRNGKIKVATFSFDVITSEIVIKSISTLDNSSSSGITDITKVVINHCAETLAPFLASFYNQCIQQ